MGFHLDLVLPLVMTVGHFASPLNGGLVQLSFFHEVDDLVRQFFGHGVNPLPKNNVLGWPSFEKKVITMCSK